MLGRIYKRGRYNEEPYDENGNKLTGIRTVIYQSKKETLLEAFKDYDSKNFDTDNIINSDDEFEGGCLDIVKYLSVIEVVKE